MSTNHDNDWIVLNCSVRDARLVKAAPRLLESLKQLVKVNEEWNASVETILGRPSNWNDGYLDEARAAIADAEGEANAKD